MKEWKTIRRTGITLLILFLIGIVILSVGNLVLNHYLNNKGKTTLNNFLPINGLLSYDKVSIDPFRSFPDISLKLHGLQVDDSLVTEHKQIPLILEGLFVNTAVNNLRKKRIDIKSIELSGLALNVYDNAEGYSNIRTLVRKKIEETPNEVTKNGWTIDYANVELNIKNVIVNKIDIVKKQNAHLYIEEIDIRSIGVDSAYHLSLDIDKIAIANATHNVVEQKPVSIDHTVADVELSKSFSELTLLNLQLDGGEIDLQKDSMGLSNFSGLLGSEKSRSNVSGSKSKRIEVQLDGAEITLTDINISLIDFTRTRHLDTRIDHLATKLDLNHDSTALVDLNLDVDQLAFNTDKGAFLSNSIVQGKIRASYKSQFLELVSPDLRINSDDFDVKAIISLNRKSSTTLTIVKTEANAEGIRPLLTNHIQQSISPYDVKGPIDAKAQIVFTPGQKKARVNLDLKVENQTVLVQGEVIKNANASATFINSLYDDQRQYAEDKKNLRLFLHYVDGSYNDFQVEAKEALITSTPEQGARLIAKADVTGKAASASKFLNHDRFSFQEGAFSLSTDINGSLADLDDLVSGTDLHLSMSGMQVYYPAGSTTIPLRILELTKEGEKTIFEIEGLPIDNGSPIRIKGEIDHIESMMFPGQKGRIETEANIRASSISWEGLIAMFGKDGLLSATKKDSTSLSKRSMKQTLTGIQRSFQPNVNVIIDTVHYGKEVELYDFRTGLNFEDDQTLVLEETSFKIDKSNVTLDGEVIINQLDFTQFDFDIELQNLDFDALLPKFDYFGINLIKQIHDQPDNLTMQIQLSGELDDSAGLRPESIDAYVTYESFAEDKFSGSVRLKANPATKKVDVVFGHSGHPRNLNHILESDAYRFDKGWFNISFEFDDNFESIAQMVEESKMGLTIADAEVFISELDVTIPLSRIEVAAVENDAFYHMLMKSDSLNQELALDGVVKNIRHFAFRGTKDSFEVDLTISSPRIVWENLNQIIAFTNKGGKRSGKIIKESLTKILQDFNPNVKLILEKLEYSEQLAFNDIFAHAYIDNEILKIDSANVAFSDSHIEANLDLDVSHPNILPFDLSLALNNIDISEILEHFDYFNREELRTAKKIDGNVWLDLKMGAEIDLENNGFLTSKTDANLEVDLRNLIVEDLEPINKVAKRLKRDERFKELRFAPIASQIRVLGSRIEIKETEVQSNAVQAFVEGTIDKNSAENLWISIPIKNLRKPNLDLIPEKTGYAASGKKIFLQWISSEEEDHGKTKVKLNKKKFFKERAERRQYKSYRKKLRQERRKAKKALQSAQD